MGLDQPEKSWKSVPAKRKRVSKFGINKTGNAKVSFYLKIPFVRIACLLCYQTQLYTTTVWLVCNVPD